MIKFTKIRAKNFLSIGNRFVEIELDTAPTTLIVGENGAGKSCLLDMLCFVLYNKAFRKINKPQLVNSQNDSNMIVEVEFTSGNKKYLIRRGIKPNIFEIHIDGKLLNQDAKAKDYQLVLEKQILQMNYKAFTQVVILGSASFVPFMQLSAADRRTVIEEILDIRIFSVMHTILKQHILEQKEQLKDVDYEIKLLSEKIKIHEENLKRQKTETNERVKVANARIREASQIIQENQEKQKEILDEISFLQKKLAKLDILNKKKEQYLGYESAIKQKEQAAQKSIDFMNENETCPICNQDITDEHKHLHIETKQSELEKYQDAHKKLQEQFAQIAADIENLSKIAEEISQKESSVAGTNQNIQAQQQYIAKLNDEVRDILQKSSDPDSTINTSISQCMEERQSAEKKRDSLVLDRHYSDIAYKLLKDSGIKTKIVQQYIPIINKLINYHLDKLNFYVSFTLDDNFNEIIKSRHRDSFSYSSFSEGEKARIDIAMLLTWREIAKLKNSASTNLMILDEIFDSSLDGDGITELLKIFMTIAAESGAGTNTTNIVVISHKQEEMLDKFDRVIKVSKHKNFSKYEIVDGENE